MQVASREASQGGLQVEDLRNDSDNSAQDPLAASLADDSVDQAPSNVRLFALTMPGRSDQQQRVSIGSAPSQSGPAGRATATCDTAAFEAGDTLQREVYSSPQDGAVDTSASSMPQYGPADPVASANGTEDSQHVPVDVLQVVEPQGCSGSQGLSQTPAAAAVSGKGDGLSSWLADSASVNDGNAAWMGAVSDPQVLQMQSEQVRGQAVAHALACQQSCIVMALVICAASLRMVLVSSAANLRGWERERADAYVCMSCVDLVLTLLGCREPLWRSFSTLLHCMMTCTTMTPGHLIKLSYKHWLRLAMLMPPMRLATPCTSWPVQPARCAPGQQNACLSSQCLNP